MQFVNDFEKKARAEIMCAKCVGKAAVQTGFLEYLGFLAGTSRSDPMSYVKPFAALVFVNIAFDFLMMEYKDRSPSLA